MKYSIPLNIHTYIFKYNNNTDANNDETHKVNNDVIIIKDYFI